MKLHLQAFVTVLSLMNPVVCGMIFVGSELTRSPAQRLADATKREGRMSEGAKSSAFNATEERR
jgi:hypothetical protein